MSNRDLMQISQRRLKLRTEKIIQMSVPSPLEMSVVVPLEVLPKIKQEEGKNSKMTKVVKMEAGGSSSAAASCSRAEKVDQGGQINILSLHDDVFQEIFSHLTYDEVAKLRLVCRQFNETCQKILNKGFMAVQRYHNRCLKEMKAKLPRRESERRTHPLARHIDVLTGIETRLSLLSMTYYKYTVLGVFCFIPGKVLDECYRVLREVIVHKNPPKSYELLQELRDISSMAMEHFEEHIVPTMKRNQVLGNALRGGNATPGRCGIRLDEDSDSGDTPLIPPTTGPAQQPLPVVRHSYGTALFRAAYGNTVTSPPFPGFKLDFVVQQNRMLIHSQRRQITELKTKLTEYGRKIIEQDKLLNEYGRKLTQLEQKVSLQPVAETSSPVLPDTNRKRPIHEDEEENPNSAKRNKMSAFSMSLRNRKI